LPVKRFARVLVVTIAFALCFALPAGAQGATGRPVSIVVVGDSLSAGFGLAGEASFPSRLSAALKDKGVAATVANAGVSGDTASGGLERLDWSVPEGTDAVILELGANDMLRGIDPATVRANLDAMIEKIKASGARLLLVGMRASPNWGEKYQKGFDRIYPELARAHGVALYPFFLDGVAMNPDLNQPDGLHPNARGVAIIVKRIAPRIEELLGDRS
jgi:acyl-CoA thioesterase-1